MARKLKKEFVIRCSHLFGEKKRFWDFNDCIENMNKYEKRNWSSIDFIKNIGGNDVVVTIDRQHFEDFNECLELTMDDFLSWTDVDELETELTNYIV